MLFIKYQHAHKNVIAIKETAVSIIYYHTESDRITHEK